MAGIIRSILSGPVPPLSLSLWPLPLIYPPYSGLCFVPPLFHPFDFSPFYLPVLLVFSREAIIPSPFSPSPLPLSLSPPLEE